MGFILVLVFKNSFQKLDILKMDYKLNFFSVIAFVSSGFLSAVALVGGVTSLNKVSEFLYFNF